MHDDVAMVRITAYQREISENIFDYIKQTLDKVSDFCDNTIQPGGGHQQHVFSDGFEDVRYYTSYPRETRDTGRSAGCAGASAAVR